MKENKLISEANREETERNLSLVASSLKIN